MSLNVKSSVEVNTSNAQASINNLTNALNKFNAQGQKTSEQLAQISKNTNKMWDNLAHTGQAITGWASIVKNSFDGVVGNFIKTADAINTMNARLKQVSSSEAHFQALKNSVNEIARATYSSTESMATLL